MKKRSRISSVTKTDDLVKTFGVIEKVVANTHEKLDESINPVRETVFKRYPTIFTLLVTIGATATFLGFEQIFLSLELFNGHPWRILFFGIVILIITGRLYKKLS